jgi:hypothetical protein
MQNLSNIRSSNCHRQEVVDLLDSFELLRDGKCLQTIPGTFIACSEGSNFCSKMCQIKETLKIEARKFNNVSDPVNSLSLSINFLKVIKELLL